MANFQSHVVQKGLTLIELIVVLALMGVVAAGAVALYTSADASQKATQIMTDTHSVRASVRQMYSGQGTYGSSANLNQVLIDAGRLPNTLRNPSGSTIYHGLNGEMNVVGNGTTFQVALDNISTEACVNILLASGNWEELQVGSGAGSGTSVDQPVGPEQATNFCSGDSNTITFHST